MNLNLKRSARAACAVLLLLVPRLAAAQEGAGTNSSASSFSPDHLFDRGRYEAALTSGVFLSPFGPSLHRPTLNYSVTGLQLGYMLRDVKGSSWWRGNFELAGEAFGDAIYEGPGSYIAGGTLWLRYNFVPRELPRLAPFLQIGGGFVSTDIDHEIVGQPFNFNLDAGAGVRYFAAKSWALSLELRYQHISNANLSHNNLGVNAAGPLLGVTCFF